MKAKAAITDNASGLLIKAFGSPDLFNRIRAEVLADCLHVDLRERGPAEDFLQMPDLCVSVHNDPGIAFCLSMVSVTDGRAPDDFKQALEELERICVEVAQSVLEEGQRVQLFVSMVVDRSPSYSGTAPSLLERDPIWVDRHGIVDP